MASCSGHWCSTPGRSRRHDFSFGGRAALSMLTIFPQIAIGAWIALSPQDLYPFYELCGRIYPELGAHYDQTVGGLIVWIPPAMMGVLGVVLVLNALRKYEEKEVNDESENRMQRHRHPVEPVDRLARGSS